MLCRNFLKIFTLICVLEFSLAGVIRSASSPSPLQTVEHTHTEEFEKLARLETEEFINNMFTNQIIFFNKVKKSLKTDTQRYRDIDIYVQKLQQAKQETNLEKKDEIYWETLKKIDKATLLLNDREETGLEDAEYQKILEENGIKDLLKNFMADVAVYFWKMAKHSRKLVETTVDHFVANMQKEKLVF